MQHESSQPAQPVAARGWFARWHTTPLYLRIVGAVVLGVLTGVVLGERAAVLEVPAQLVLRVLGALAPPLILLAIVQALMHAQVVGRQTARLVWLLVLNTLVAISIGMLVANVVQPGRWVEVAAADGESGSRRGARARSPGALSGEHSQEHHGPVRRQRQRAQCDLSGGGAGHCAAALRHHPVTKVDDLVHVALQSLIVVLYWIVDVVPLAVFGVVASIVGVKGFGDFVALGGFVVAVLLALALQTAYYLTARAVGLLGASRSICCAARATHW